MKSLSLTRRWPRSFIKADGERILWHVLDYLRMYYHSLDDTKEPMKTILNLISEVQL